jgi:hypothetical protein
VEKTFSKGRKRYNKAKESLCFGLGSHFRKEGEKMKVCPRCGKSFKDEIRICPACGSLLVAKPLDPAASFKKKRILILVLSLLNLAITGFFFYLCYKASTFVPYLLPAEIGGLLSFLLIVVMFVKAEDYKPFATIAAIMASFVFVCYAVSAIWVGYAEGPLAVDYFKAISQGSSFSFEEFSVVVLPILFSIIGAIFGFVEFLELIKAVGSIHGPLIPVPLEEKSEEPAPAPTSSASVTTTVKVAKAPNFVLLIVFLAIATAVALACCGFVVTYRILKIYDNAMFSVYLWGLPVLFVLALVFLLLGKERRGFCRASAIISLVQSIICVVLLGVMLFVYFRSARASSVPYEAFWYLINMVLLLVATIFGLLASILSFRYLRLTKPEEPAKPLTVEEKAQVLTEANQTATPVASSSKKSFFDGGLLSLIGNTILNALIIIFTLGIAYPWVYCRSINWRCKHTVVDGYRVSFSGKALDIFGKWVLWILLFIVTLGIYGFWIPCKLHDFEAKNSKLVAEWE